jgi:hypothetical protein
MCASGADLMKRASDEEKTSKLTKSGLHINHYFGLIEVNQVD